MPWQLRLLGDLSALEEVPRARDSIHHLANGCRYIIGRLPDIPPDLLADGHPVTKIQIARHCRSVSRVHLIIEEQAAGVWRVRNAGGAKTVIGVTPIEVGATVALDPRQPVAVSIQSCPVHFSLSVAQAGRRDSAARPAASMETGAPPNHHLVRPFDGADSSECFVSLFTSDGEALGFVSIATASPLGDLRATAELQLKNQLELRFPNGCVSPRLSGFSPVVASTSCSAGQEGRPPPALMVSCPLACPLPPSTPLRPPPTPPRRWQVAVLLDGRTGAAGAGGRPCPAACPRERQAAQPSTWPELQA